jgi:hypothetical protein
MFTKHALLIFRKLPVNAWFKGLSIANNDPSSKTARGKSNKYLINVHLVCLGFIRLKKIRDEYLGWDRRAYLAQQEIQIIQIQVKILRTR